MYNSRRLFVASCLALITSAFSFQMRQDVADDVGAYFHLTKEVVGALMGGQFLGMALAMLIFAPLCDWLGMGKVLGLAWLCHLTGISGTIFADQIATQGFAGSIATALSSLSGSMANTIGFSPMPNVGADQSAFWVLWLAAFIIGSANGMVEIAINPLAATLYPDNKTHKLNVLHAWWPGGLILGGLLALFFVNPLYGAMSEKTFGFQYAIDPAQLGIKEYVDKIPSWKFKYGLIWVPMLLYGLMAVGQRFPETERVQANVSTLTMFLQILRPLFIIWAFCMLLTASTELGVNAWMESVLKRTAGVSGTLFFVYTSMIMFVLRFFAGPLVHKFSPVGLLFFCSILTAGGLYWLSFANTGAMAFAAVTVFGLGITYYWPTMLGVTAERFPKGGALLLGLMGCVGNLAISQVTPLMGAINDSYTAYSLPPAAKAEEVNGKPLVIKTDIPRWVPPEVSQRLYPAQGLKVNPEARSALEPRKDPTGTEIPSPAPQLLAEVQQAEVQGAAWSFRWTAVMPCVLIVIFGLIALYDKLRGGYRAEQLRYQPDRDYAPRMRPSWPKDMTR
jgi:MFS family permease